MMRSVLALVIAAIRCLAAPDGWIQAGNGASRTCAGTTNTCNSIQTCTYHAYGPCGGAASPSAYFEGFIEGVALVRNEQTYLQDSSQLTVMNLDVGLDHNGYHESQDGVAGPNGARYAYITSGAFYGDKSTTGVYLGMAAYVMELGTVSTNKMSFLIGQAGSREARRFEGCMVPTSNGVCGEATTFAAGDYKFSLFGHTHGDAYVFPAGATHFGFRTAMTVVGATPTALSFNNGLYTLENIGHRDVTSLKLTVDTGSQGMKEITMTFPQTYNTGSTGSGPPDTPRPDLLNPPHTKNIKIRASRSSVANQFFLDYLFEKIELPDHFFIYDPTVRTRWVQETVPATTTITTTGSSSSETSAGTRVAANALGVSIAVATLMMLCAAQK